MTVLGARSRQAWEAAGLKRAPRVLLAFGSLAAGVLIWVFCLHFFYAPDVESCFRSTGLSFTACQLADRQLGLWTDPPLRAQEIARMRASNAEWDFMGRTFLVMALGDISLRDPARKDRCLGVIDQVIDETLRLEKEHGMHFFLMSYSRGVPYVVQPVRSLFVDGEIALMLGVRQMLARRDDYAPLLAQRIDLVVNRMEKGPVLSSESYPNECWLFCNTVALAAIRVSDFVDGRDHSEFCRRWVQTAKDKLVDPRTGLLISAYTLDGTPLQGPEGSSIWSACVCLRLVDEAFAQDQYERARRELIRGWAGFNYSREWPASWPDPPDVDSGLVVPGLRASPSASGLALIATSAFRDRDTFSRLAAALDLAGFPVTCDGGLKYAAGNQVGDAVILYAMVTGPLWQKVREGRSP